MPDIGGFFRQSDVSRRRDAMLSTRRQKEFIDFRSQNLVIGPGFGAK